jgi:26S proteasome regulatory subunit N6
MTAVANAASKRSLQEFESITQSYTDELVKDVLIQHHLSKLREQLLESNLIRIIEPYSCVEISHVAYLMEMQVSVVEKKLSQMILDKKLNGILDQGKGHLIVYEETDADMTMEKGLQVIANVDDVVTALFTRSNALRSMMA